MVKGMVHEHEKQATPSSVGRRDQRALIVIVDTIIGCEFIVLRIESYICAPQIWRRRLYSEYLDKRVTLRRYSDLEAAARAYHALKRTLDLGRLPYKLDTQSSKFIWMSDAVLTAAAAETMAGRDATEFLRKRGVIVSDKTIERRNIEEFWHSQILNDARA
jgi:hypothetical protein